MLIPHRKLSIDINRPNQYTVDFIAHVGDKNTRYIDITLNADGEPIELEQGCTATVTYVSDGVLIEQEAECVVDGSTVIVGIDTEKVKSLRSGILEIQPKIVDGSGNIIVSQIPVLVRISPDIAEHGRVDDDSLGTYAEVVREIAAARGSYTDLKDRLDNTAAPTDEQVNEAVRDYLDAHPATILRIDTVAEMVAMDLNPGTVVLTEGYHAPNDGGGAMYRIVSNTQKYAEELENGIKAELIIIGGCKNARQFGAYGDGVTDDTTALQTWLNDVASNGGIAYLPHGQYKITAPITVDWGHHGGNPRNFLQRLIGDGCTSYESGYDNSCIIAYNIGANRGALEFISDGNTWGTQVEVSNIGIYCDSSCNPMSFCLFYGDSRQLILRKVKMRGNNNLYVRCGSKDGGTSSYEHLCVSIEHCDLLIRGSQTMGFSLLPESVGMENSNAYSMFDNLAVRDTVIGGVFVAHVNNLTITDCVVSFEGLKDKTNTSANSGRLNGYEIDYATGILIVETASTIIRNVYFEDFKRGIDIVPICGNIRNVLIEGCYFNPGSNQVDNNNNFIMSDYGVLIRTGKSGAKVVYTEISHNVFRHDETAKVPVYFAEAAIKNEASKKLLCYANAGRPNNEADQIESPYGEFITESDLVNPTKTSELTNDSGFLTQHQDISGKVDKVDGKGLSTNDYTTAEKNKLASLEPGNSIWKTSTAPTAPDAEQNLGYGFAISTLTGADRDVQIGDMILYSYYYYTVTDIVNSVAYAESRVSIRGAKGATYTLTEQDKTEIANEAVSILPVYNGGVQ